MSSTFTWIASECRPEIPEAALTSPFGDGYEQRVEPGIAPPVGRYALTFRRRDQLGLVESFLASAAGVDRFTWTPPGGTSAMYLCRAWQRHRDPGGVDVIDAVFERVYI